MTGGTSADTNLPRNRVGHQGLFADRFDAATAAPQLAAGARLLYHNRNRSYHANLGRYLQLDPQGTSQATLAGGHPARGIVLIDRPAVLRPEGLFFDGMNRFQYVESSPCIRTDPSGLFWGYVALGAAMGLDIGVGGLDNLNDLHDGYSMGAGFRYMIAEFAVNQEFDVEWALDWSQGDDDYSRRGTSDNEIEDPSELTGTDGRLFGRLGPGGGVSHLAKGLRRSTYNARRQAFIKLKPSIWKREAKTHAKNYSEEQKEAMHRGEAPIGEDGFAMRIHHRKPLKDGGKNEWRNYQFMTKTHHEKHFKDLHYPEG